MIESILSSAETTTTVTMATACIYAAVALVLGMIVSFTYIKTGRVSKNFARTLIILPILVCVVMMAVNGNFGTSLAVLGAFSLVRFRSLQGSSRDIGFIFLVMTIGIVCAIGQLLLATVITIVICLIHFILQKLKYAESKYDEKSLKITIPESLDFTEIFDDLFDKYTTSYKQVAVKTTNMGSMYEINYKIVLKELAREKDFLDEIRMRNGNLTVICARTDANEMEEL